MESQSMEQPQPAPATLARSTEKSSTPAVKRSRAPADPEELRLREVRKNNLAMLTSAPGAKSKVGELSGLSPVNISHRLHGTKHFDRETAEMFCRVLGLPAGWFEVPRSPEEVPSALRELLGTPREAAVLENKPVSPLKAAAPSPRVKGAPRQALVATEPPAVRLSAVPSGPQVVTNQKPTAPSPAAAPVPTIQTPAQAQSLAEAGPVAEALARTVLAMSSRGSLSENKALEFLNLLMAN
jgi:hypothetical protein